MLAVVGTERVVLAVLVAQATACDSGNEKRVTADELSEAELDFYD